MDNKSEEFKEGDHDEGLESDEHLTREDFSCRFYRKEWPEIGDIVVVSLLTLILTFAARLTSRVSPMKEPTLDFSSTTTRRRSFSQQTPPERG